MYVILRIHVHVSDHLLELGRFKGSKMVRKSFTACLSRMVCWLRATREDRMLCLYSAELAYGTMLLYELPEST